MSKKFTRLWAVPMAVAALSLGGTAVLTAPASAAPAVADEWRDFGENQGAAGTNFVNEELDLPTGSSLQIARIGTCSSTLHLNGRAGGSEKLKGPYTEAAFSIRSSASSVYSTAETADGSGQYDPRGGGKYVLKADGRSLYEIPIPTDISSDEDFKEWADSLGFRPASPFSGVGEADANRLDRLDEWRELGFIVDSDSVAIAPHQAFQPLTDGTILHPNIAPGHALGWVDFYHDEGDHSGDPSRFTITNVSLNGTFEIPQNGDIRLTWDFVYEDGTQEELYALEIPAVVPVDCDGVEEVVDEDEEPQVPLTPLQPATPAPVTPVKPAPVTPAPVVPIVIDTDPGFGALAGPAAGVALTALAAAGVVAVRRRRAA